MSIGQRIKASRKAAGMSQLELAQRVGLRQPTLSDLENDTSKGSGKLASIAHVLNVRSFWLETGRGPSSLDEAETLIDSLGISAEALEIAKAFDRLQIPAQKAAIRAQLAAFGTLNS